MNVVIRPLLVLVAVGGYLPAFATETGQAATSPAEATAASAPVATPGTASPPATPSTQSSQPADAATTKSGVAEEKSAARIPSGYRLKQIDGEKVYCRKETPLGSRFPTEVCMTPAQYEESVRQRDALRQEITGRQKSYSNSQ